MLTKFFVYKWPDILVGTLYVEKNNQKEVFSFEYDSYFLKNNNEAENIDSQLGFYKGIQYSDDCFNFIKDMCPDRWGRNLLIRNERAKAKEENRQAKELTTIDYLIFINDLTRMGDLRIKDRLDGQFLSIKSDSVPKMIYLRELEEASHRFEEDINSFKDLEMLLDPGSSLGGARPKANVYDNEKSLFIAKFPSLKDDYDVELLEKIATDLASYVGINVPFNYTVNFKNHGTIFLSKRFDRENERRIPYISAMSFLNANDGDSGEYSFLDLAQLVTSICFDSNKQLEELYKRMVFSYMISNNDNHLRNHGFIKINNRWVLSPMFDINPSIYKNEMELHMDISSNDSYETAIKLAPFFSLNKIRAESIITNMYKLVNNFIEKELCKYKVNAKEKDILINAIKTPIYEN